MNTFYGIEKLALNLDINKGDILLGGRFKNMRMKVNDFGTDELGQPTVNKKKLLSFRIEKLMPKGKMSSQTQEMNKTAKGKYPIVEDEFGRTLTTGMSVGAGAHFGAKLAKRFSKKARIPGAIAGALAGTLVHNKLKSKF